MPDADPITQSPKVVLLGRPEGIVTTYAVTQPGGTLFVSCARGQDGSAAIHSVWAPDPPAVMESMIQPALHIAEGMERKISGEGGVS